MPNRPSPRAALTASLLAVTLLAATALPWSPAAGHVAAAEATPEPTPAEPTPTPDPGEPTPTPEPTATPEPTPAPTPTARPSDTLRLRRLPVIRGNISP
jgi:hypothetical protein